MSKSISTGHIISSNTVSEENYIKTIYKLEHELEDEVTMGDLAGHLATKASSVTSMVRKLADKELVNYSRYRGVTLTAEGERIAVKILRKHRLWELFLFRILDFRWDEIHEIAEELEHIKSDALVERIDFFLNYPRRDPHGDPIPDQNGNLPENKSLPLSKQIKGYKGTVVAVRDDNSDLLAYLTRIGVQPGTRIEILELNDYDNSFEIKLNDLNEVQISNKVAANILTSDNEL